MIPDTLRNFIIGIAIVMVLFYVLGRLLKRKWWILAIVLGVLFAVCVTIFLMGMYSDSPDCPDYAVLCYSEEMFYGFFAAIAGIGTLIVALFGLPTAYIASKKQSNKKL